MRMTQERREAAWNGMFHRLLINCNYDFNLSIELAAKRFGNGAANYALENKELIMQQTKQSAQIRAERGVRLGFANPAHNNINL